MKHPPFLESVVLRAPCLSSKDNIKLFDFHPDLFLSLFDLISDNVVLQISDELFDVVIKHLSILWDDDGVVFIGSPSSGHSPGGFISDSDGFINRSKGLLSGGFGDCRLIVCSSSGMRVPILGAGIKNELVFNEYTDFDLCCRFLNKENYTCVDVVSSPGEYCLRGGLIDLFPTTSFYPYRVNFLDSIPLVSRFDIDTQLTCGSVENFKLVSVNANIRFPLSECSLDGFFPLKLSSGRVLTIGAGKRCIKKFNVKTLTHREFCEHGDNYFNEVYETSGLTSVAVLDDNNSVFVPRWFLNKSFVKSVEGPVSENRIIEMSDICRGDYLVHRDHGVGVCVGLSVKKNGGENREFLVLKYGDGAIVSVDVGRLDLVSFFANSDAEGISLDSLGKQGSWLRKRAAAKKQAEVAVEQLLSLYVKRRGLAREPFFLNKDFEDDFISQFSYQDTPDQATSWAEILKDLESNAPMDRLLCGDVGFGKTEMAIRATYRVVMSHKRVVVLAPTTILANQLYSSFSSRLEPFAVSVDIVSRFRSSKDVLNIKQNIVGGLNDVLIGTHALLYDDIYIKNIGLLVIDEEHRFGVKQKESIKACRAGVDVLSMSATPIPRSVNLVLSNIYTISMLQTPPLLRRPIYTRVEFYNDGLIRGAVDFEVGRGGQVFFVHNDIRTIKSVVSRLRGSFPLLSIEFIHGQEVSGKIEKKMSLFVSGKIHILVCTSIIESGIDVPSANCIIINNAHLFGLAQLYQMRGRVGRGSFQAHAYLLIPNNISLSETAYKRIKAIEQNTRLGSGYSIAYSDMEIRGAGALFGYKQSGGSGSVGYELYARLIQDAVYDSLGSDIPASIRPEDVDVCFFYKRFIPEKYIPSEDVRLSVYKNISLAFDDPSLDGLAYNLVDRFGEMPVPVKNLINESRLRSALASAGISVVVRRGCGVVINLSGDGVDAGGFLDLLSNYWEGVNTYYHIVPIKGHYISFCVHLLDDEYSYSLFLGFIDKFSSWEKNK